jgi:hypothetical protein
VGEGQAPSSQLQSFVLVSTTLVKNICEKSEMDNINYFWISMENKNLMV